jgi:hypothetical protein
MNYIKDEAELNKRIVEVKRIGKMLDSEIHELAVSALHHIQEYGNVTALTMLADALPKSSRRQAFIFWACTHAPVQYNGDKEAFGKAKGKVQKPFLLVQAESTPFWEFSKERKPATVTIEGLVAYITNKIKKGLEQGDIALEDLAGLDKDIHAVLSKPSGLLPVSVITSQAA